MAHTKQIAATTVMPHHPAPAPKSPRFWGANFRDGWWRPCFMSKPYLTKHFGLPQSAAMVNLPDNIRRWQVVMPNDPVGECPGFAR
jgi:hypothetical protein